MQKLEQSYGTGVLFVLLATLGWSLSGVFVRLMPGLDGWQLNCWRGFWAGVVLLIYLISVYGRDTFRKFAEVPKIALLSSALFFSVGSTLYVSSLTMVSTATVSVIGATSPLFIGLLGPLVTGEKAGVESWVAAGLAVLGVGIIAGDGLVAGEWLGLLMCLGVPMLFAGQTLALRKYRDFDMVPAICFGGFLTFLFAGFMGFSAGHPGGGFDVGGREVALLAAMGLLQLAIPLMFYIRGAVSVPAITLSLIAMLDAVINPLWPWLIVGETPNQAAFVGGSIVIGAVLISIFGRQIFLIRSRAAEG